MSTRRSFPPDEPRGVRIRADIVAALSVAAVLLPQSMAYAELAGLPPHLGLFAGAVAPTAAAFFASSPWVATGPSALTSLLTFGALAGVAGAAGEANLVGLAALLALVVGVIRVVVGLLRAGSISYLMSQPVVRGFTLGAAFLIIGSQLPKALGVAPDVAGVLPRAAAALADPARWSHEAIALAAGTVLVVLGGKRVHKRFPGVLVVVVAGALYGHYAGYAGATIEVPALALPSLDLPWSSLPSLLVSGLVIALVGFAEVASVSQTYAERTRTRWDPDREFTAQGVANLAAGFAGAFPVGASFSRSALSHLAGTRTRLSGGLTGLTLLCFLPFAWLLSTLPLAVLGAIVIAAAIKLLDPRPLLRMWKLSWAQAAIGTVTFVATLTLAPHVEWAVLIGVGLAVSVHVWREHWFDVGVEVHQGVLVLTPEGVLWFATAPRMGPVLAGALAAHPDMRTVHLDLSHLGRIDLTGAVTLAEIVSRNDDVDVRFVNVPEHAERILAAVCPEVKRAEALASPAETATAPE